MQVSKPLGKHRLGEPFHYGATKQAFRGVMVADDSVIQACNRFEISSIGAGHFLIASTINEGDKLFPKAWGHSWALIENQCLREKLLTRAEFLAFPHQLVNVVGRRTGRYVQSVTKYHIERVTDVQREECSSAEAKWQGQDESIVDLNVASTFYVKVVRKYECELLVHNFYRGLTGRVTGPERAGEAGLRRVRVHARVKARLP